VNLGVLTSQLIKVALEGRYSELGTAEDLDARVKRALTPEDGYTAPQTDVATEESLQDEDEFGLDEISDVAHIIDSSRTITSTPHELASS
jgi:hypothetical protein